MVERAVCCCDKETGMITKVKKIIIFGGGTSGWLTAAYLTNNLKIPTEVVLIEDTELGPIGVGEGTQPFTAAFLYQCGLQPKDWMKPSSASFKLGVELIGWNDEPYFVDNDDNSNCIISEDLYTSDYFVGKDPKEFSSWHPAYQLAKKNVCPKIEDHYDLNFGTGNEGYGAVHFSAYEIIKAIKNKISHRITHIDTKIEKALYDIHGITKLVDTSGKEYSADLYIDCTGFSSILLEKTLGVPFMSYDQWLPCDRAVVLQTQFKDPKEDCHPYTKATAMNAGWRFTIPIHTRIGNGYIYSSKFISDEDAEKELRESVGEFTAPAKFLKMKCGTHREIAFKNVCAVGLSAGFVEPLEATGITFTTGAVKSLGDLLNMSGNIWDNQVKKYINDGFYEMSIEILAFVWSHYFFSTKNDTDFWKNIRKQKIEDLPQEAQKILSFFLPMPNRFLYISPNSMFNVVQWFSMLNAGGVYKNQKNQLSEKQQQYAEYFLSVHTHRVEHAKKIFPNQYEYLSNWYGKV